jgi:hypothetical protein
MTSIHCKDSQSSRRHPHGTGDMQGYGELVQEWTPRCGKDRLHQHGSTKLRCQRERHLGTQGKKHRPHKKVGRILGKNGSRNSLGNSREMGWMRKELDQDQLGNEGNKPPWIRHTRWLCRLARHSQITWWTRLIMGCRGRKYGQISIRQWETTTSPNSTHAITLLTSET